MHDYHIAMVPGDGIGQEMLNAVKSVLGAVQETSQELEFIYSDYLIGEAAYKEHGDTLPAVTLEGIKSTGVCMVGAVSAGGMSPLPSSIGRMRRELGLFADVRPIKSMPGAWSLKEDIDILFVRENLEGFLADRNLYKGSGEFMPSPDTVVSLRVLTRTNCMRIARYAFSLARKQNRKKITAAHKSNVLRMGCGFFLDIVRGVAQEYPDIALEEMSVDNVANTLISCPSHFDVILTTNLFGDILSDEAAALVSNLAPSANIGESTALFMPVNHSGHPDDAGKDTANPLMYFLCAAMMLHHLGEDEEGKRVESAVLGLLEDGKIRPADMGGIASKNDVTAEICRRICAEAVGR